MLFEYTWWNFVTLDEIVLLDISISIHLVNNKNSEGKENNQEKHTGVFRNSFLAHMFLQLITFDILSQFNHHSIYSISWGQKANLKWNMKSIARFAIGHNTNSLFTNKVLFSRGKGLTFVTLYPSHEQLAVSN